MRTNNRKNNETRKITIDVGVNKYAEGSCLIKFENTQILCTATVEEKVPGFLRNKGQGWLSAEYSMVPRSTHTRMSRDNNGKPNGRALEIQRLIGRSLRMALDMNKLGERQILIDCDVLQADGSTRCAAITGGFVALSIAIKKLLRDKKISENPIVNQIAAVSCGIAKGQEIIDLDYEEDLKSTVDSNFILSHNGEIVEIQTTAEGEAISFEQMTKMYHLAKDAIAEIARIQQEAINK